MLIDNQLDFDAALSKIQSIPGKIVVDCETTGLKPFLGDRLVGIAVLMHQQPDVKYYFTFRHANCANLTKDSLSKLFAVLSSRALINHNIKFDLHFMHVDGLTLPETIYDTMLSAHLLNENEPSFALKTLADKYIGEGSSEEKLKLDLLLAARKLAKHQLYMLAAAEVAPYAIKDVELAYKLYEMHKSALEAWKLWNLFEEVNRYCLAICRMEIRGLPVNKEIVNAQINQLEPKLVQLETEIKRLAGFDININSPKQLMQWLDIPATDRSSLEKYLDDADETLETSEGIRKLLAYRKLKKEASTYYIPFSEQVDENGRLHGSFKLHGTVSGRLSCEAPNLQNLPRSGNSEIKKVVQARSGYKIIEADFSQLELRIVAHYANIKNFKHSFANGIDAHQGTADATGLSRDNAKTINFGILYGMGPKKLIAKMAYNTKKPMSLSQGMGYIERYHKTLPEIRPFEQAVTSTASRNGYIRLFTGRVRRYDHIKAFPHTALNNLIQGSGAEATRIAITRMDKELTADWHPKMLATVHDSVLFEVKDEFVKEAGKIIKDIMEDHPWCTVKLKVDLKYGDSWGNLQKLEI